MIDPIKWRDIAATRSPSPCFCTDWIDGTQEPVRAGVYERHFTDSEIIAPINNMQIWDGFHWRTRHGAIHWRQVGDYPCWRGLTEAQAQLQGGCDGK